MNISDTGGLTTVESLKSWLASWLTDELMLPPETIASDAPFLSLGMNSVQAMTMVGDLETKLELRLSPTLVWDYGNIDTLATHLHSLQVEASPATLTLPTSPAANPSDDLPTDAAALLAELDMISDEDVDRLLGEYLGTTK